MEADGGTDRIETGGRLTTAVALHCNLCLQKQCLGSCAICPIASQHTLVPQQAKVRSSFRSAVALKGNIFGCGVGVTPQGSRHSQWARQHLMRASWLTHVA